MSFVFTIVATFFAVVLLIILCVIAQKNIVNNIIPGIKVDKKGNSLNPREKELMQEELERLKNI